MSKDILNIDEFDQVQVSYIIEEDLADDITEAEFASASFNLEFAGEPCRLDAYLAEMLSEFSRSRIQGLIKEGLVLVNAKAVKPSLLLKAGDSLDVLLPPPTEIEVSPENIPLDVIYEDKDVIVVNKARGMVVHPAVGNYDGTLVNALLYHCQDLSGINGKLRPGIVHRIDKETSGLIIAAKNDAAHQGLVEQWQTREVERHYLALLHGLISEPSGIIDAPIGRHPKDRKKMTVTPNGKRAITNYKVLERYPNYTLIDAKLDTGRTHQIRVHMNYLHHPVVGDIIYGPKIKGKNQPGQFLHSAKMRFKQPLTGEWISCEAPIPDDFADFLDKVRKGYK